MKEFCVFVQGVSWRIKADDWSLSLGPFADRGLARVDFHKESAPAEEGAEPTLTVIASFVGQAVAVFDPNDFVSDLELQARLDNAKGQAKN